MAKYRVMIAQFPGGGVTSMHTSPWLLETFGKMLEDPQIGKGNVLVWQIADTPITMGRNRCLVAAEKHECDFVLMLDNDMFFDLPYADSVPFWDAAWPFALEHGGPCVIGAPYCGPPPNENVYVFRFENTQSDDPNPNFKLYPYARNEATMMKGIKRCAALPTGLMLIDMRAVKRLSHPRFYYEWTNEQHTDKASTEDVTFSRDLTYAGVPLYCAWDSWAGHIKPKMVGRPQVIPHESVPGWMVEQAGKLDKADDRLAIWKEKPRGDFLLTPRMYGEEQAEDRIVALLDAFGECLEASNQGHNMSTWVNDFASSVYVGASVYPAEVDADDSGSSVDMISADGQCFAIQIIGGVGGTDTPTLAGKIEESTDGTTWTDVTGATFTNVTTSNNLQSIVFQRTKRYLRHTRTVSGTSPTFNLSCVIGEVKKTL